jgi:hypothetical protein
MSSIKQSADTKQTQVRGLREGRDLAVAAGNIPCTDDTIMRTGVESIARARQAHPRNLPMACIVALSLGERVDSLLARLFVF